MESIFDTLRKNNFGQGIQQAFTQLAEIKKLENIDVEKSRLRDYLNNSVRPLFNKNSFTEADYQQGLNHLGQIATGFSPEVGQPAAKQLDVLLDNYAQHYKVGKYSSSEESRRRKSVSPTFGTLRAQDLIGFKDVVLEDGTVLKAKDIADNYNYNPYYDELPSDIPIWKAGQEVQIGNRKVKPKYDSVWFNVGTKTDAAVKKATTLESIKFFYKKEFANHQNNLDKALEDLKLNNKLTEDDYRTLNDLKVKKTERLAQNTENLRLETVKFVNKFFEDNKKTLNLPFGWDNVDENATTLVRAYEKNAQGQPLEPQEQEMLNFAQRHLPLSKALSSMVENINRNLNPEQTYNEIISEFESKKKKEKSSNENKEDSEQPNSQTSAPKSNSIGDIVRKTIENKLNSQGSK